MEFFVVQSLLLIFVPEDCIIYVKLELVHDAYEYPEGYSFGVLVFLVLVVEGIKDSAILQE
jgi:hypothetical protein